MQRHMLSLFALLTATAAPAFAQSVPPLLDPTAIFANADTNGDKMISRQEFLTERAKLFARLDRNGDGVLNRSELTAAGGRGLNGPQAGLLFRQFDANDDGAVTQAEFNNAPSPGFDRADVNHDGVLSQAEIQAARARRR